MDIEKPRTISRMIELLGGQAELERRTSIKASTIGQWKAKNFLPPKHWKKYLQLCKDAKIPVKTADDLLNMHQFKAA